MVSISDAPISQTDWTRAVSQFDDITLLQTWAYGEAVSRSRSLDIVRVLIHRDREVIGAAQALVRRVPYLRCGVAFINRGPVWARKNADPSELPVLLRELRRYWVEKRGLYLRIAPPVVDRAESTSVIDSGFDPVANSRPWISARVDLSKTPEALRAALRSNWKSALKKAEGAPIRVEIDTRRELLHEINSEYERLLSRNKYQTPVTPAFLESFQDLASPEHRLMCLVARVNGKSLGGVILARYGQTCEYLVGAVGEEGRKLNVGQLLLWNAVLYAKQNGYRWLDVGGADPDSTTKGILLFKEGLGGETYRLMREIEACPPGLLAKAIRWRVSHVIRSTDAGER